MVHDSQKYVGNKMAYGSYQNIINEFPLHQDFISGFAGSGAVEKRKLLAPGKNIVFEISKKTVTKFWSKDAGYQVRNSDFIKWYKKQILLSGPQRLIYNDPPYWLPSRSSGQLHYGEYDWSHEQHEEFLELILQSKDLIAVSQYKNSLYDKYLKGWRLKQWPVMTHTGAKTEALYMNYDKPLQLHQYDYLGKDYTDRQRCKRRRITLINQMERMTAEERCNQMQELNSLVEIVKRYLAS